MDADLTKRVIEARKSRLGKFVGAFAGLGIFTVLLTFGLFPDAKNRRFTFSLLRNELAVETIALSSRLLSTPLLLLCKFIVKSYRDPSRTNVIKIPLVRHMMHKKDLRRRLRERSLGMAGTFGMGSSSTVLEVSNTTRSPAAAAPSPP